MTKSQPPQLEPNPGKHPTHFKRSILWQLNTPEADLTNTTDLPPAISPLVSHILLDPTHWSDLTRHSPRAIVTELSVLKQRWGKPIVVVITDPAACCQEDWLQADGFYIPGPHSRQGDLLSAVGATGKALWIERGSFLAPTDFENVLKRVQTGDPSNGTAPITLVDTGSQYGYADRVLDTRALCHYADWGVPASLSYTDLATGSDAAGANWRPRWADRPLQDKYIFLCAQTWGMGIVFKNPQPSSAERAQTDHKSSNSFLADRAEHLATAVRHLLAHPHPVAPQFDTRLSHE
jgi:hypothetical protein